MFSLITDDILDPGDEVLTFDYLVRLIIIIIYDKHTSHNYCLFTQGRRYIADLLPEGTIRGDGQIYASPYAWASHCKNQINPDQKTAIGWGHVRRLCDYGNIKI